MAAWYGRAVALGDARELLDELGVLVTGALPDGRVRFGGRDVGKMRGHGAKRRVRRCIRTYIDYSVYVCPPWVRSACMQPNSTHPRPRAAE